ncbi:MAG: GAP family protein [Solirubrobacterales bacterium]|nr:GAP family protein [Solirubrobacterales bacterium]
MLRLVGVVVSVGLADSLNPTTVGPALYLCTGERPRRKVLQFTIGVFAVYLLGGALIALGPGQLLLSLVPKPGRLARHILEVTVGVAMITASFLLWRFRERLANRRAPQPSAEGRSSALLGATITAIELPTAFPYFAAIAAIVGSGLGPPRQILLLVLFNICFVLPLIGMLVLLTVFGDRGRSMIERARDFGERRWPVIVAPLLLVAGVFAIVLGVSGLESGARGRFHRFVRHFRNTIHP